MEVFNRWGEKIHLSERFNEGWDGKINGVDAKEDVYIYRIEYSTNLDPKAKIIMGRFNLIR
jgi:gliding motility-associated-like protein